MSNDNTYYLNTLEQSKSDKLKYFFVYDMAVQEVILKKMLEKSAGYLEYTKMSDCLKIVLNHENFHLKQADASLIGADSKKEAGRHYIEKTTYQPGEESWQNYLYTLKGKGYEYVSDISDVSGNNSVKAYQERKQLKETKKLWQTLFGNAPGGYTGIGSARKELTESGYADAKGKSKVKFNARQKQIYSLFCSGASSVRNPFQETGNCRNVLTMLGFFDKFLPLSALGYILQRRLKTFREAEPDTLPVIIRGIPPLRGLQFENIYRIIKAQDAGIRIQKTDAGSNTKYEITKPGIDSGGRGFMGKNEEVFLKGQFYPVEGQEVKNISSFQEVKEYEIPVYFLLNKVTGYLENRWAEIWIPLRKTLLLKKGFHYSSPYYRETGAETWNVIQCVYKIREDELEEFSRWCDSFGDFAAVPSLPPLRKDHSHCDFFKVPAAPLFTYNEEDLETSGLKTPYLFSYYNSMASDPELKTCPTQEELCWFEWAVRKFPNFCRIFLDLSDQKQYEEWTNSLAEIVGEKNLFLDRSSGKSCFDGIFPDLESPVQAEKYREIIKKIRYRACCITETREASPSGKKVHLCIPYILDMNYSQFMAEDHPEPFTIMVYDLKEKRSCAVKYADFNVKNSVRYSRDSIFSLSDRYYYLCAYIIRRQNRRPGTADHTQSFIRRYEDLRKTVKASRVLSSDIKQDIEDLLLGSFQYIYEYIAESASGCSPNENERLLNGVSLFQEAEIWYKSEILKLMREHLTKDFSFPDFQRELMDIPEEDITDFLTGSGRFCAYPELVQTPPAKLLADKLSAVSGSAEQPVNEAVYSNELKKCLVRFRLLPGTFHEKNIDLLYNYFREFNCFGQYLKEENDVLFSVEFPRFEFRRIHQIMLALSSIIDFDTISPRETAEVLRARIEGKERNRELLSACNF
ncbi:MAG TPA: hypothetical protein H9955_11450 [Candidatus Mediterraneibacter cottocaccae]|nr:hypothetical protein [Candidatus Mediterraneibacter cottocaccae]